MGGAAATLDFVRGQLMAWVEARYSVRPDDVLRLVEQLERRSYPSLQITSAVFPDEFHVTVPQLILSRALRSLYNAPG